jgi:hypothetical protein
MDMQILGTLARLTSRLLSDVRSQHGGAQPADPPPVKKVPGGQASEPILQEAGFDSISVDTIEIRYRPLEMMLSGEPGSKKVDSLSYTWRNPALQDSLHPPLGLLLAQWTDPSLLHAEKHDSPPYFYHFLTLPLLFEGQPSTVEMHMLIRRDRRERRDPSSCLLALHLPLPRTGPVDLFVHVMQNRMNLHFFLPEQASLTVTEDDVRALREGLRSAGYHLGSIRMEKQSSPRISAEIALLMRGLASKRVDITI